VTASDLVLVGLVAFVAGVANAVAGGGTLLTFPALTAVGIPSVAANLTNTVALSPGYLGGAIAQRDELRRTRVDLRLIVPLAIAGGLGGAALLLAVDEEAFEASVPYLIIGASLLLAAQPRIRSAVSRSRRDVGSRMHVGAAAATFGSSIYGGFFGAGLGIILLAALGVTSDESLVRLNAVKQLVSLAVNVSAAVFFVASGRVVWSAAVVMAFGSAAGGHFGGSNVSRMNPTLLRSVVVCIGLLVGCVYLFT
jgi:uncharacterized membrane protein YfcA